MRKLRQFLQKLSGATILLSYLTISVAAAASANISHSYSGPADTPVGSLVSLTATQSDEVELANVDNGLRLVGVTLASQDSLLAINGQNGKLQVANSGEAQVLVTDLNGSIKVGDEIGVSPFSGYGMKAETGSHIIGLAQNDFSASTPGATRQQITDKTGKKSEVTVGFVKLNISVGVDSNLKNGAQLNGLQKLVKNFNGRTISTIRIVTALAVAIVALVAIVTLIYASIFGSIISIGRNPLAKYAILRSLFMVLGMAFLICLIAGGTIYFLLS